MPKKKTHQKYRDETDNNHSEKVIGNWRKNNNKSDSVYRSTSKFYLKGRRKRQRHICQEHATLIAEDEDWETYRCLCGITWKKKKNV